MWSLTILILTKTTDVVEVLCSELSHVEGDLSGVGIKELRDKDGTSRQATLLVAD